MTKTPVIGSKSPRFKVKDTKGVIYTENDLMGKPAALIFLSEKLDETSLHLLHLLRDNMEVFLKAEALILVISPYLLKDNVALISDHNLNFPILRDESRDAYRSFGLVGQTDLIDSTVILDSNNLICWIERPIKYDSHLKRVLKVLKEHAPKHVIIPDIFDEYQKFVKDSEKKDHAK